MKENNILVWKYFLQQKAKEILKGIYLFILLGVIMGAFFLLLFGVIYGIGWIGNTFPILTEIFLFILLGVVLFIVIYTFGMGIGGWIKSNWEEAKMRARK